MENIYAIYSYKFVESNDEGDWTQGEQVTAVDMDAAQDWFYNLFGKTKPYFLFKRVKAKVRRKVHSRTDPFVHFCACIFAPKGTQRV